jgi:hypothetical protein
MRTWVSLSALVVYLIVGQTAGGESVPDLYQPVESRTNLLLESTPGRAIVERDGGIRQTLSVRPGEILTTVAETSDGWAAAGIRPLDEGTDLVVIRRGANGTERLSPPGPKRHDLRLRPILLTDRRDLGGIAWLEGANLTSLSVRAATRSAEGWDETTVVSPTAKGSQTGLVGVEI